MFQKIVHDGHEVPQDALLVVTIPKISLRGRNGLLIAAVTTAVIIAAIVWFGSRAPYEPLLRNLTEVEAGQVIAQLEKQGVPYRLEAHNSISIPADMVRKARIDLAMAGAPKDPSSVGWELFDNKSAWELAR
ncbi:hypothetical protein [Magnetofaba australis]|uniref:Flagellar M-ring N-terminal domain-containing protein n=1 Tax=Magnetofaba australis IT-1 TaxID=1434232 RepID=A0A1Y2K339_9PROT|nr:hypothetical protein [Magnetofaba australis]OSM01455.1 hypothetical protein MAIT1_01421 [Magnetofaba australis IT-1]